MEVCISAFLRLFRLQWLLRSTMEADLPLPAVKATVVEASDRNASDDVGTPSS